MVFLDYIPIYLLVTAAIFSIAAIFISKIIDKTTILNTEEETFIQKYIKKLDKDLRQSRTGITLQQYMVIQIGCPALLAFVSYFLSDNKSIMIIMIAFGMLLPGTFLTLKKNSENKKFEDRFVRALAQMSASLHSGLTVEKAIDSVINCELLNEYIRDDFRKISSKMKLGLSISDAFYEFAEETGGKDAFDVATAITIMTELGGDAGEAVEKLQKNIESRLLYRKKRESMMTESKLIAIFSDVVPILILIGVYVFMPGTIESYFEKPILTILFVGILAVMFVGTIVVRKMLNSESPHVRG